MGNTLGAFMKEGHDLLNSQTQKRTFFKRIIRLGKVLETVSLFHSSLFSYYSIVRCCCFASWSESLLCPSQWDAETTWKLCCVVRRLPWPLCWFFLIPARPVELEEEEGGGEGAGDSTGARPRRMSEFNPATKIQPIPPASSFFVFSQTNRWHQ